jgi:hypothetical protein
MTDVLQALIESQREQIDITKRQVETALLKTQELACQNALETKRQEVFTHIQAEIKEIRAEHADMLHKLTVLLEMQRVIIPWLGKQAQDQMQQLFDSLLKQKTDINIEQIGAVHSARDANLAGGNVTR